MAFSPTTIVLVSCIGAFLVIGIAAVIHRMYTGPPGIDPGTQIDRSVNNRRPSDQQARLEELREIHNRQIWERAKEARREQGLPTPNWYPGSEWLFSANATTTQASINGNNGALSRSAAESHLAIGLDVLECPNRIGHAYQAVALMHPHEDATETDEDEYGTPVCQLRVAPSTPRMAPHIDQAVLACAPTIASEDGWELQELRGGRSSSAYSVVNLGEDQSGPPARDLTAPPVVYAHGRVDRGRQASRVHDMVARWEAAHSRY